MTRAMTRTHDHAEPWLLDEEVWDSPDRLTDADLFAHAGPGWRRGETILDNPEDNR